MGELCRHLLHTQVYPPKYLSIMSPTTKITLTYFDAPGRAEITRLIFAYAGREFEDKRIDFATFQKMKPELPFGQLLVLWLAETIWLAAHPCTPQRLMKLLMLCVISKA